jgi:hypothetical protein
MVLGHPKFQSQPVLEKEIPEKMSWLSWNLPELNGSSSWEKEIKEHATWGIFQHTIFDSQMVLVGV